MFAGRLCAGPNRERRPDNTLARRAASTIQRLLAHAETFIKGQASSSLDFGRSYPECTSLTGSLRLDGGIQALQLKSCPVILSAGHRIDDVKPPLGRPPSALDVIGEQITRTIHVDINPTHRRSALPVIVLKRTMTGPPFANIQ